MKTVEEWADVLCEEWSENAHEHLATLVREIQADARRAALEEQRAEVTRMRRALHGIMECVRIDGPGNPMSAEIKRGHGQMFYTVVREIRAMLDDAGSKAEFYAELEGDAGGVLAVPGRKTDGR